MDYEAQRAARIAANKERLKELGVLQTLAAMKASVPKSKTETVAKRKRFVQKSTRSTTRRSRRLSGSKLVSLDEDVLFRDRGFADVLPLAPTRRGFCPGRSDSAYDSGLGVRRMGKRIYDSKNGVTCHWCRQKTLDDHVVCTSEDCGGGRTLPVSFCRMCLWNRHGEDVFKASASGKWICPKCRGGCGEACSCCCNCGPCRKKRGLSPTHQIVKEARISGFTNVHDYLIHLKTGESPSEIDNRKQKFFWGKWLGLSDNCDGGSSSEEEIEHESSEDENLSKNLRTKRMVRQIGTRSKATEKNGSKVSTVRVTRSRGLKDGLISLS